MLDLLLNFDDIRIKIFFTANHYTIQELLTTDLMGHSTVCCCIEIGMYVDEEILISREILLIWVEIVFGRCNVFLELTQMRMGNKE